MTVSLLSPQFGEICLESLVADVATVLIGVTGKRDGILSHIVLYVTRVRVGIMTYVDIYLQSLKTLPSGRLRTLPQY